MQAQPVLSHLAFDHQARAQQFGVAAQHIGDLAGVNEHAPHLGSLVGASHPALDAHIAASRGALAGQHGAEVAGAKADQRVVGVERGDHHLAHFTVGQRVAGARTNDLDDHPFVDHQALARRCLVGHHADVSGGIDLKALHATLGQPDAQRRRKGLAADQGLLQAGQAQSGLGRLLKQDAQKAGRARVGVGLQMLHGLQLLLGVAHATRKHGAAQGLGAALHDPGARRHVITEAVVH